MVVWSESSPDVIGVRGASASRTSDRRAILQILIWNILGRGLRAIIMISDTYLLTT